MMDEEDEHSPTSFIILRIWKLLIQKMKQVSTEDHRRFINQQKIANTNKKMATDTDTNTVLFGGGAKKFIVPKVAKVTTTFGLNTFQFLSISTWNSLPDETRSAPDLNTFKRCIKQLTF